jgi:Ca2+-transporting ATPase
MDTFNSRRMNMIAGGEIVGAFLITQADFMNRLLGTTQLTAQQWGLALLSALILLGVWELAKWFVRSKAEPPESADPAPAAATG